MPAKTYPKEHRDIGNDPYLSFRFKIEVDKVIVGGSGDITKVNGFSEVSGLTTEVEVETIREGGQNLFEHKLAGAAKYPSNIMLKRGLGDADTLWSWYLEIMRGRIQRRSVAILLWDHAGKGIVDPGGGNEKVRWTFREACPVKWVGPEFRAGSAEVAFESLELVHRGLSPPGGAGG